MVRHCPEQYGYLPDGEGCLETKTDTETRQQQPNQDEEGDGFGVRPSNNSNWQYYRALNYASSVQIYILGHPARYNALNGERRSSGRLNLESKLVVRSDTNISSAG